MSDSDLVSLAAFTPVMTDIQYGVDNPGGSPVDGKHTYQVLQNLISPLEKAYHFQSFSGSSGTNWVAGFYDLTAADLNLTQASATGVTGTANVAYGAHAILVAGGVGGATGGTTGTATITCTGTSITDAGVRNASATEVLVTDVTAAGEMAANVYHETVLKWIGQVTYTIATDGDRTTFNADFNVGFAKYEDFHNTDFTVTEFEVVGLGGAADTGFDVTLYKHVSDNWVYHATAFVAPTGNDIARMTTDYVTEVNLANGVDFAYKRSNLSEAITGTLDVPATSTPNGIIVQVITGANASVQDMDVHITATRG